VRNNGWRDRCADPVCEPCRGPTAPAVLATLLGDYDTTALPTVFPVSAGNYQRTRSDFGGNPGPPPARRTKEQHRTRYSCDRRYWGQFDNKPKANQLIHQVPRTNRDIKNPTTPAKAGAHARDGSRPFAGKTRGLRCALNYLNGSGH
jgi:hypothetical protein